jgi:hypothetical protein
MSHKIITALGSLAAIFVFLKTHPRVRRVVIFLVPLILVVLVAGCSTHSITDNGRVVPEVQMMGSELCWNERENYRAILSSFVSCWKGNGHTDLFKSPDPLCDEQKASVKTARMEYRTCFEKEKAERIIVNPFNLFFEYKKEENYD